MSFVDVRSTSFATWGRALLLLTTVACGEGSAGRETPEASVEGGTRHASTDAAVSTCQAPLLSCNGRCVDIASDSENCGACGTACEPGDLCTLGACSTTGCPGDQADCGGLCVNFQSNPLSCGSCTTGCRPPETCENGACACPADHRVCDGVCTDVRVSQEHCGACGLACDPEAECKDGVCQPRCAAPLLTLCTSACANLMSDTAACGSCGTACKPGEACVDGTCVCPAESGLTVCGVECVDLQGNGSHCGACGNVCPNNTHCEMGQCTQCVSGFFFCPSDTGDPLATCIAQAQEWGATSDAGGGLSAPLTSAELVCQCTHCLAQLQDCLGDPTCVSEWQCAVRNGCTTPCWRSFSVCGGGGGSFRMLPPSLPLETIARLDALHACVHNNQCGL